MHFTYIIKMFTLNRRHHNGYKFQMLEVRKALLHLLLKIRQSLLSVNIVVFCLNKLELDFYMKENKHVSFAIVICNLEIQKLK